MAYEQLESISDIGSQNDESFLINNDWVGKRITEEVANIAEENLKENGFIFIHESGLYYNSNQNCYYSPQHRLYYYVDLEAYYTYDEESGSLKLYSHSSEETQDILTSDCSSGQSSGNEPATAEELTHEAPCLRIMVKSSQCVHTRIGSIFVVTAYGASIGRSSSLVEISLPDKLISKYHSRLHCRFTNGQYSYEIEDAGSTNGTYVDCKKLESNVPALLCHGSMVTVGSTELQCHIHHMYEVCSECTLTPRIQGGQAHLIENSTILEKHKSELSHLKKKFGLHGYNRVKPQRRYQDRAELRRITKGSSCEFEKTDSTSIDVPMRSDNKGYILLKKMGWSEDRPLGKPSLQK